MYCLTQNLQFLTYFKKKIVNFLVLNLFSLINFRLFKNKNLCVTFIDFKYSIPEIICRKSWLASISDNLHFFFFYKRKLFLFYYIIK